MPYLEPGDGDLNRRHGGGVAFGLFTEHSRGRLRLSHMKNCSSSPSFLLPARSSSPPPTSRLCAHRQAQPPAGWEQSSGGVAAAEGRKAAGRRSGPHNSWVRGSDERRCGRSGDLRGWRRRPHPAVQKQPQGGARGLIQRGVGFGCMLQRPGALGQGRRGVQNGSAATTKTRFPAIPSGRPSTRRCQRTRSRAG